MKLTHSRGFTLTELLVVISIIGILAAIVLSSISKAREKAQIAKAVIEVKELGTVLYKYYIDTDVYAVCAADPCLVANDPLQNDFGVLGWGGPYGSMAMKITPWGGRFETSSAVDLDGGGNDYVITLNDDSPGTAEAGDDSLIPLDAMLKIDQILDDGNLATGNVRGNGLGFDPAFPALGELMVKVVW